MYVCMLSETRQKYTASSTHSEQHRIKGKQKPYISQKMQQVTETETKPIYSLKVAKQLLNWKFCLNFKNKF